MVAKIKLASISSIIQRTITLLTDVIYLIGKKLNILVLYMLSFFLHISLFLVFQMTQEEMEAPTQSERLFAILFILILMVSSIAIYFLVRSKRVLQSKFNNMKDETHAIEEKNDELAFRNDSLKLINDEKNNAISIVAHDLKTPLGNVEGLANLISLEKDNLSKSQMEYLDLIIDTSIKAREKIDVMMDVHRIESEIRDMNSISLDYLQLIKDVIDLNKGLATSQKVEVELIDHVRTNEIKTDADYFKQIFSNILSNAIEYSPENEKVIILVTEKEHSIKFDISDSGSGMDENAKKRLFTSYSLDLGKEKKSTAMGLYIARKLVEKLNGKIRLESSGEEGTTFSVEFFK